MRALYAIRFLLPVSFTLFLLVRSSTYFPWGMEFAIFRPLFRRIRPNAGANSINGGIIVDRQWIDRRGNQASCKVTICLNQPLPGADRQGER
jgi:hypothetical protein